MEPQRSFSRRDALKVFGMIGLGAFLTACGVSTSSQEAAETHQAQGVQTAQAIPPDATPDLRIPPELLTKAAEATYEVDVYAEDDISLSATAIVTEIFPTKYGNICVVLSTCKHLFQTPVDKNNPDGPKKIFLPIQVVLKKPLEKEKQTYVVFPSRISIEYQKDTDEAVMALLLDPEQLTANRELMNTFPEVDTSYIPDKDDKYLLHTLSGAYVGTDKAQTEYAMPCLDSNGTIIYIGSSVDESALLLKINKPAYGQGSGGPVININTKRIIGILTSSKGKFSGVTLVKNYIKLHDDAIIKLFEQNDDGYTDPRGIPIEATKWPIVIHKSLLKEPVLA